MGGVGRAIDPTTDRGRKNLMTGGAYELNRQALGGGGGKGGSGAPSTPDFVGAAQEQTRANRPDQTNPFSSSNWEQDANGNWSQNVSLTPGLNDAFTAITGNLSNQLDPAAARDAASKAAYEQSTSRLDPQWSSRADALQTQLTNQGLTPGSMAYNAAQRDFNLGRNDAYAQADYNAQTGAGQAAFGQSLAANMQPYQQLQVLRNLTQQNAVPGAGDLLGALGQQYQGQMNAYGIDQAGKNSLFSGLTNLGAGALAASDERLKQNIERLPFEAIPGVPFATWEWKHRPGEKQLGVIAQDLEKVRPDLVEMHDGVRFVNYAGLWEARHA